MVHRFRLLRIPQSETARRPGIAVVRFRPGVALLCRGSSVVRRLPRLVVRPDPRLAGSGPRQEAWGGGAARGPGGRGGARAPPQAPGGGGGGGRTGGPPGGPPGGGAGGGGG